MLAQITLEIGVVIALVGVLIAVGAAASTRFVSKDACQQCKQGLCARLDALKELLEARFRALEEAIRQLRDR